MSALGAAAVCLKDPELCEIALVVLSRRGYSAAHVERAGARASARAGRLTIVDLQAPGVVVEDLGELIAGPGAPPRNRVAIACKEPTPEVAELAALGAGVIIPHSFSAEELGAHLSVLEQVFVQRTRAIQRMEGLVEVLGTPSCQISSSGVILDMRCCGPVHKGDWTCSASGLAIGGLFSEEDAAKIQAAITTTIASQKPTRIQCAKDHQGQTRHYELRLGSSGGDRVVAAIEEFTEKKAVERRLVSADRFSALGTLSGGIAHEINNPLTYVLIGIESVAKDLRRRGPDQALGDRSEVLLERLDGAMQGARRVRRIVSDLRAFAKSDEEAEDAPVDIRRVLDAAASTADSQIRYRALLERNYQEVADVMGNADRLGQLFVNLLLSAARTIPEGDAASNFIRMRTFMEGGQVVVEVEDSGPGIPSSELESLFDPLHIGETSGDGSGLNLWMCRSLAAGHGGEISALSPESRGKTLRVVFPAAAPLEEGHESTDDANPIQLGRVLVIDDDDQVAHSLGILFEGGDVVIETSGRLAFERIVAGEQFDWIFCDLMMPDMSGMDFFEAVQGLSRGVEDTIVFMTGGAFTRRAREFVASIRNPCLAKPFLPRTVADILRKRQ